ncbi:piggyBac transposable element-derived protein 4 [Physeter macrocephalus]|uniref:PiggyBac transposable element-derived protein 4 n=1 Tax=Physeter macrocephalus TaxID=9755 RepID=A0A455BLF7_PHYMC|nr:uncharacterized protein LOC114486862 [Physeter catodon]XP_028349575.1 uncharacterized protein LOC114486862 [Physeter catodon]XP_028349576.1 uncharacterized protein LOC114486862 [Physeter catodon]XP_028349577.1 uncharacterized protein LOC114486862 [Physeter catodon]XP_054943053.1 uncharacterized protein LOC114486862 [Physeter catodon]XP_054943054.1 uncharacterized protein LOC114486862 [Physeter catodon]XP_054943055.1 uncharacterized protein LOC114486862 [Physeter catodon]XP_054943056.1 unc|eukprot:XP_028349572.1 uncharacterized protein LOC114486862 [Physeter catodon]
MFMSGFTVLNNHLLSHFAFILKNINCCFTYINQQDLIYGKKYSVEMLCCNVGKCNLFHGFYQSEIKFNSEKKKKSHWEEHWSTDLLLETPIFPKIMTRRRFEQIMTFLHFNDNSEIPLPADRISKVKPLLDYFLPKFQLIYIPKQELSLDEAMIRWRGQLRFKTCNPGELTKYGILVRMVSKSETVCICSLEIYMGKGKKLQETILLVLQPYLGSWHHIYQDSYYNSVFTSEIRENHGLLNQLKEKSKNLQRGEMTFLWKGEVILLIWKDKRLVRMVTTIQDTSIASTGKECRRTGHQITKPTCI